MASPMLESYCCMFGNNSDIIPIFNRTSGNASCLEPSTRITSDAVIIAYNILCVVSSALSICGATYQLIPRRPVNPVRGRREIDSVLRQNYIICCLTLADLFATIGILVRSSLWLSNRITVYIMTSGHGEDFPHLFCAISSGLIQYFYISTYFWTFTFALDTYLLTVHRRSYMFLYHVLCWGVSAVITAVGLIPLYTPSLLECAHDIPHVLPHYLSSYVPMLLVMILNPVLYSKASIGVERHFYGSGSFTQRERRIIHMLKMRFRAITITFCACWMINIVNGIFVPIYLTHKKSNPVNNILTVILCLTAILNPLQGFLNSVIYKSVGLCPSRFLFIEDVDRDVDGMTTNDTESSTRLIDSTESSPLLRGRSFIQPGCWTDSSHNAG